MTPAALGRRVGWAIVNAGLLWVCVPALPPSAEGLGPLPGHPERVRPGQPPSAAERRLWRQLTED